ncbi:MAG: M23 family metallopeptidase [Deltaproteobacteria bacterium]|nr:MAG: M23 family metallopeptidase [Deltaproteobacteria bacterium]
MSLNRLAVAALLLLVVTVPGAGRAWATPDGAPAKVEDADALPLAEWPVDPERYGPFRLKSGVVLPYPLDHVFRGFADCRRGRHHHKALDIGGLGPSWGLGTPVVSMARAKVTRMGAPEDEPERWGTRLTKDETVFRGNRWLPTSAELPVYGRVWFFTEDYGRSRTGVFVSTRVLEGRLKGHTITYMHLGAVHPALKVGDIVEAGQEIGVMGGTAVMESAPHVHVQIKNARDRLLDVGPILGVGPTAVQCRRGKQGEQAQRARYSRNAVKLMAELRREAERTATRATAAATCGPWSYEGTFASGDGVIRHRVVLPPAEGPATVTVEVLEGKWQAKLQLHDRYGAVLWDGRKAEKADVRRFRMRDSETGQRRKKPAALTFEPREPAELAAVVTSWGKKAPPAGARYRVTVTRPCPEP